MGDMEGLLDLGGPCGSCCVSISYFLCYSSIPKGTGGGTRKRMKFWKQKLIINSAGELHFRGSPFQCPVPCSDMSDSLQLFGP